MIFQTSGFFEGSVYVYNLRQMRKQNEIRLSIQFDGLENNKYIPI